MHSGAYPKEEKNSSSETCSELIEKLAESVKVHCDPDRYKHWSNPHMYFLPAVTKSDLETLKRNLNEVLENKILSKDDLEKLNPGTLRDLFTNEYGKQALKEKLFTVKELDIGSCLFSRFTTEKGLTLLRNTKGIPVKELAKLVFYEALDADFSELDTALNDGNINSIQEKTADSLGGILMIKYYNENKKTPLKTTANNEKAELTNDERPSLQFGCS